MKTRPALSSISTGAISRSNRFAICKDELAGAGIRSKRRVRPDGTEYGGQKIARGALYLMLQNRIYRGEITHKGNSYPGEHPAIIDQPLWDEVQAVLAENRVERATGARAKHPSLLGGLVFDETGERLTPTYAVKKGTRYRYYVSSSLVRGAKRNRSSGWRIPAGDLEGLVINRLRTFFADPAALLDAVDTETHGGSGQSQLIERGRQIAEELGAETPDKVKATLMALLCRVAIHSDRIEIALSRARLPSCLPAQSIDLDDAASKVRPCVPMMSDLDECRHASSASVAKCECWSRVRMTKPRPIRACSGLLPARTTSRDA